MLITPPDPSNVPSHHRPFAQADRPHRRGGGRARRLRPLARSLAPGLLAASLLLSAGRSRAQAYISPFSLNIQAPAAWFSDYASRTDLIRTYADPAPAAWSTSDYNALGLPWGPLNPQLYSVPQALIGDPAGVNALRFDRGAPVYETPLNTAPPGTSALSWASQRLGAAAQSLLGTPYQHLHLPQFNPALVTPPGAFSWNPVSNQAMLQSSQQLMGGLPGTQANPYKLSYGQPAAGIDCTDLTAYLYSLALGYQLHSGTGNQVVFPDGGGQVGGAAAATVLDASGSMVQPSFLYGPNYGKSALNAPGSLDALIAQLQVGDLLYIGNRQQILHVVMWLGGLGTNADGTASAVPLVISSHDNTPAIFDTQDINFQPGDFYGYPLDGQISAHLPPPGVHVLPFTDQNWFYQDFQLAMRLLPTQPASAAVPAPALPGWAVLLIAQRLRRLRRRALRGASTGNRLA